MERTLKFLLVNWCLLPVSL